MKSILSNTFIALLLLVGFAALILANMGILSFDKPNIYGLSSELSLSRVYQSGNFN